MPNCKVAGNPSLNGIKEHLMECRVVVIDDETNRELYIDSCGTCGKVYAFHKDAAPTPNKQMYPQVVNVVNKETL